jgi:hypothetical protein
MRGRRRTLFIERTGHWERDLARMEARRAGLRGHTSELHVLIPAEIRLDPLYSHQVWQLRQTSWPSTILRLVKR